ncbi:MAG: hypothetical protein AAF415_11740 [Pseudomonadota bacterium]
MYQLHRNNPVLRGTLFSSAQLDRLANLFAVVEPSGEYDRAADLGTTSKKAGYQQYRKDEFHRVHLEPCGAREGTPN